MPGILFETSTETPLSVSKIWSKSLYLRICAERPIDFMKGLDLDIERGEFCVLLGPSGSGKSTLLNIIGGIDSADEGNLVIDGERLADMSEKH